VKLSVYKHLLDINAGFDQVIRGLTALRKHDVFVARQLDSHRALAKEIRAATNSYLTGVIERAETNEAGRRFGKRWEREQREE
jgi:transcription elongation factor GreA-like protein